MIKDISHKKSKELFRTMLRIRIAEETIALRYSEWKMRCPTHLSIGQEAVGAAVCAALAKNDFVMSTHRSHCHYLAKGGDMKAMIAELYGKATGCSSGKGGSMHLIDRNVGFMGSTAIVGGTIPLAVGLGLSAQLKNSDQVSCIFFGDGAVEEGVFYESVNFAVVRNLPVLFICENNLYSVYSPLTVRQPEGRKIHEMVQGLGMASHSGDGNDCLAAYEMTCEIVDRIRQGHGPQFIEFATYRHREHCGPNFDDDLGYRSPAEIELWQKKDPIEKLEKTLTGVGVVDKEEIENWKNEIAKEVSDAFVFAENSSFPSPKEVFTDLYKEGGAEI